MSRPPDAIVWHHRLVLGEQVKALRVARSAWRTVSPERALASWAEAVPTVAVAVSQAQEVAARSAVYSSAASVADTGTWYPPDAFPSSQAFAGYASDGRSLTGLLSSPGYAVRDLVEGGKPAAEALDAGLYQLTRIVKTTISDAGRQAAGVMVATRPHTAYVRMTSPPSCPACTILAGRVYQWNAGFQRHPGCDCVHVPTTVASMAEAKEQGLVDDPYELFSALSREEQDRLYGVAASQAIRDGADIFQVVNARRGITKTGKFTSEGTTRRGYAASLLKRGQRRATPELIYEWAGGSRTKAIQLLQEHGYILPGGQVPTGSIRGQAIGFGQMGRGGTRRAASNAVLDAIATGVRDPANPYTMTAAERRVWRATRDWEDVLNGLNPYDEAAVERHGGAKIRAVPTPLTPKIAARAEREYFIAVDTGGDAIKMRQLRRQSQ